MTKIKRHTFLKMGVLAMCSPLNNDFLPREEITSQSKKILLKDDLLQRLIIANDKQVAMLLQSVNTAQTRFSRKIGYDFAMMAASLCSPQSTYFKSPLVAAALIKLSSYLVSAQAEDGTVNIGNLESPPDTAFLVELLAAGACLLQKNSDPQLADVKLSIKKFLLKTGDALTEGGVHTPNHRWVICAALAQLNALYPNKKYTNRVADWLGEGIFMDSDGQYPERSRIYSNVENNSLLTMGRLLNMPTLFEPVRKNLETTYYYMEANGDLVTTDSRRQDQYMYKSIVNYYLQYRYLAIRDNNKVFAGIASGIEQLKTFDEEILDKALFHFLSNPLLLEPLPATAPLSINFEKLFTRSNLLRIRRGNTSSTVFGGADWPIIIASGRSNSPDFYSFRKGRAILKYMRLSTSFFSLGYFYSEGIKKEGNQYILHKKSTVPYYQPLPKRFRNRGGEYKLSPSTDGRFWNSMDFENRPLSNVKTLETTLSFVESKDGNEWLLQVTGQAGVAVTIELCFAAGGTLSGVTTGPGDNSFLEKGMGSYQLGGDQIRFGPGTNAHHSVDGLEGERYATHFGSLKTTGMHVYLTGITPFNHRLSFG